MTTIYTTDNSNEFFTILAYNRGWFTIQFNCDQTIKKVHGQKNLDELYQQLLETSDAPCTEDKEVEIEDEYSLVYAGVPLEELEISYKNAKQVFDNLTSESSYVEKESAFDLINDCHIDVCEAIEYENSVPAIKALSELEDQIVEVLLIAQQVLNDAEE